MAAIPWYDVEEVPQRLKETGTLGYACDTQPAYLHPNTAKKTGHSFLQGIENYINDIKTC